MPTEASGVILDELREYADDRGNVIKLIGAPVANRVRIQMRGRNNRIEISGGARISYLRVDMDASDALLTIGSREKALRATIRVGQDCVVSLGDNVSTTERVIISTAEGTRVTIGNDCMIARGVEIRADDAHPIFDVHTGMRVNHSRSVVIGDHVWLGSGVKVIKGTVIGSGSVIGASSVVSGRVPNNCIALGMPARVVRQDIAWERPHLATVEPFYKPDASFLAERSPYWHRTREE